MAGTPIGIGDGQANEDSPQNILNIRQHQVVRLAVGRDELLNKLARIANHGEQQNSGYQAGGTGRLEVRCLSVLQRRMFGRRGLP